MTPADWDRVLRVNLTGVFACARAAGADGRARARQHHQHGIGGRRARDPRARSVLLDEGGRHLADPVLAVEWADAGVRVNAIGPGWVQTDLVRAAIDDGRLSEEDIARRTPLGAWPSPPRSPRWRSSSPPTHPRIHRPDDLPRWRLHLLRRLAMTDPTASEPVAFDADGRLDGRRGLVTGAGHGLGLATATGLAAARLRGDARGHRRRRRGGGGRHDPRASCPRGGPGSGLDVRDDASRHGRGRRGRDLAIGASTSWSTAPRSTPWPPCDDAFGGPRG